MSNRYELLYERKYLITARSPACFILRVVRSALISKKMETNLEQLKCGQCGTEKHLVYQRQNGEILLECIECGSTSEIKITQPKIVIRNVSGLGTICPQS